jgi:hypothetical protein
MSAMGFGRMGRGRVNGYSEQVRAMPTRVRRGSPDPAEARPKVSTTRHENSGDLRSVLCNGRETAAHQAHRSLASGMIT